MATAVAAELHAHRSGGSSRRHVTLEEWGPTRRSRIWDFNVLYWQHLRRWEEVTGRGYESALPGGQSDARDVAPVRETITELFTIWDSLAERRALPEELYVVELGVGNGGQARTWLDTFVELDRAHGRDYHRRLHYLMCDYSPHVLELARATVAGHSLPGQLVRAGRDAPDDVAGLPAVQGLPRLRLQRLRQPAHRRDRHHRAARAPGGVPRLPAGRARPQAIAGRVAAEPAALGGLVDKLLRLGPELLAEAAPQHFPGGVPAAVEFWRDCWQALRLQERYVPLHGLDTYQIAPGHQRRAAAPAGGHRRRHPDARVQRRRHQLRRDPAAAAPLRQAAVPRHRGHRPAPVPHRVPRARASTTARWSTG